MTETAQPPRQTNSSPPGMAGGSRHTLWFLLAFHGLAAAWGIRNIRYWEPSLLDLLAPFLLAIIFFWWSMADARRRHHAIPLLARPWFFLLAGLVVPGYVIWSRGWRGVGWVVLNAFVWYASAFIVMQAGGYLVYGDDWLRAMGL